MTYKTVAEILNTVFDSSDSALKGVYKTEGEVLNMVLDETGESPALRVNISGFLPTNNIIDGEVSSYADLPSASEHPGEIFIVTTSTGIPLINRKQAGMYRSDGATWSLLDIDLQADKVYYSGSITAGNAADALDALKSISDNHISNTSNPHSVTKLQVGLGNVEDTADMDKPVSTAMQEALDGKSDTTHNHDSAYLGKTATAADSAKLGGVESSGYARAWTVGVNLGSARWMKLCTIAGAELGQKFSVWLSGTASAYSFPADTGSARLDITLLSSGTWAGAVYRTSAGTEGLSEVRLVQTSGSGVEIWLYMGADVNVSALVIGSNNSLVTPSSEVYTAAAPAATSSAVLYNTIQQNSGTGVVQIPTRGGLQLPNVANSTVNVFDWYEEGTWTPTIYGATTAGTPSYSIQIGRYTRIGDTVHLFLYLNGTWTVAPTGNVRIGGLPFTAMTLTNYYPAQVCAIGYALATAYLYGGSGLSYLQVGRMRDVGNSTLAISFDGTNISTTNFQYHGNFVYKV